jgi:hypothetical protein
MIVRQSTAVTLTVGPFVDVADQVTPLTSLTDQSAHAYIIKGTSYAALTVTSWTALGNGCYAIGLSTSHTDTLGQLTIGFDDQWTYLPVWLVCQVTPANVYDSVVAGSDVLDVSATQWAGTAVATPDTAGHPVVTLKEGTGAGEIDLAAGVVKANDASGNAVAPAATALTNTTWTDAKAGYIDTAISGVASSSATAILATPANKLATDASGYVRAWDNSGNAIAPAATAINATDLTPTRIGYLDTIPTTDATATAIKAKTDLLPASPAATGDIPTASDNASAVQAALAVELAHLDADVSSRLAATDPVVSVNGDVGGKVLGGGGSSITGTGARIVDASGNDVAPAATAVSSADLTGTRIGYLDTIPTIDTTTAAVKARTDLIPDAPAATGDVPTASENATAVRSELTTELGRVDVATSTRLAAASYTAPDNAGITAIKAKTDLLPADPAGVSDIPTANDNAAAAATAILTTPANKLSTDGSGNAYAVDDAGASLAPETTVDAIKAKTDLIPADIGDAATATELAAAVTTIRGADGDTLETLSDQIDAIPGAGSGSLNLIITVLDQSLVGIPDVEVAIYDASNTVYQTKGTTGPAGTVTFPLAAATYSTRARKAGVTFTNPGSIEVDEDGETMQIDGVVAALPVPASPEYCAIYEDLLGLDVDAAADETVTFATAVPSIITDVGIVAALTVSGESDVNGRIAVNIRRGARVTITSTAFGSITVTVPDQDQVRLQTLIASA